MKKIKCLICGMTINDKNYNLNASTFAKKNKEDHIVHCPFCGVADGYFAEPDTEISIPDKPTHEMRKILDMGMKLEIFNGQFYEVASKQAQSEELRLLFQELSRVEWMHARVHKIFGGLEAFPNLRVPDYSRHDTDRLLLAEAQKREAHAIAFYERYYGQVPLEIQVIFDGLMEVEKEHLLMTEI